MKKNVQPEQQPDNQTLTPDNIRSRLRQLREGRELTQAALAEKFQVDTSLISKLENGHRELSVWLLDKYSSEFEVTTDYIVYGGISDYNGIEKAKAELAKLEQAVNTLKQLLETM